MDDQMIYQTAVSMARRHRDRMIEELRTSPDPEKRAEGEREARWTAFVDELKQQATRTTWSKVCFDIGFIHFMPRGGPVTFNYTEYAHIVIDFSDEFGWADVYTALGRAMREAGL